MPRILETPHFKTKQEEANWWDNNPDALLAAFQEAATEGTLTRGTLKKSGDTTSTTLRLDLSLS